MIAFIDDHRAAHGVEPICKVLPIAPSTYHANVAKRVDPSRLSARVRRDDALKNEVRRVFDANFRVYGVRKVWRQLQREGFDVARCTVARLMRVMGLAGIIRGKPVRTTISDKAAPCPLDHVNRQFHAPRPNALWVSDFTYVTTWTGFVYVAFVIDAYARRIVGWRVSRTAHAAFVLDALEQALHDRRPVHRRGLIHHSDRGSQLKFKRSSHHLNEEGCDGHSKATSRSVRTSAIVVTGTAAGRRTARTPSLLDVDREWDEQRGSCNSGGSIAAFRTQMVQGGGRHATSDIQTNGESAIGKVFVINGARGDRVASRTRT